MSIRQLAAKRAFRNKRELISLEYEGVDCIVCRRRDEDEHNLLAEWHIKEYGKVFLIADYTEANIRAGLNGGEPVIGITSKLTVKPVIGVGLADQYTVGTGLIDQLAAAGAIKKLSKIMGLYRITRELPTLSDGLRFLNILQWELGDGEFHEPDLSSWLFDENGKALPPSVTAVNPVLTKPIPEIFEFFGEFDDDIPWP